MSRYRSQVREVINRNTVISLALDQGFNAFLPVYDGGDFILYRERDGLLRKVQLKGRWTIDRKYLDRDIWMAFPMAGEWYLMPHDAMVAQAEVEGVTKTASWIEGGAYSKPKPSVATISVCSAYRMEEIEKVVDIAGHEAEQAGSIGGRAGLMYWWNNRRIAPADLIAFAWSAPMRDLAARVGMSDVCLKKLLRSYGVMLPSSPGLSLMTLCHGAECRSGHKCRIRS